jgi:hypothetical protein
MSRLYSVLSVACAILLCACTSMGHHHTDVRSQFDFGPPEKLSICLLVNQGISEEQGRKLVEDAWAHEGQLYGIQVQVVSVTQWSRPAFDMEGILAGLRQQPLEAPCDRVLALFDRSVGDFLWGLVGPEVLGAVNNESLTHGYAFATRATLAGVLNSPTSVMEHEIYHLLGCGNHYDMNACYAQIARLKQWKRENNSDFFPAWDLNHNRMLATRAEVNVQLASVKFVRPTPSAVAKR